MSVYTVLYMDFLESKKTQDKKGKKNWHTIRVSLYVFLVKIIEKPSVQTPTTERKEEHPHSATISDGIFLSRNLRNFWKFAISFSCLSGSKL